MYFKGWRDGSDSRVLTVLPDDGVQFPAPKGWLIAIYSSRGSNALFGPFGAQHTYKMQT